LQDRPVRVAMPPMADAFRSGFVAVVGKPNAGKSTLVNALVGEKVSIVTSRPQTTRQRIIGIRNRADSQTVFVDTPGLHAAGGKLINRAMNRAAVGSLVDADIVLLVVEAQGWRGADSHVLQRVAKLAAPVVLVVNKIDAVRPRTRLLPLLAAAADRHAFAAVVPLSAATGENLDQLLQVIESRLPVAPACYPSDAVTDRGRDFRLAEALREQLMAGLGREVPYGVAVEVAEVDATPELVKVAALVWVAKTSQRPIVLGRGGERIKAIGTAARLEMERLLGTRVFLETHVKVRDNWADDARALQQLGYEAE
jgi:GTP-binding protein Era